MPFKHGFILAAGGVIGTLIRGFINSLFPFQVHHFGWATFIINTIGCFLIGFLWQYMQSYEQRLFVVTGILGSFTTFSGFGMEVISYFNEKLYGPGLMYLAVSVSVGIFMVWLGQRCYSLF